MLWSLTPFTSQLRELNNMFGMLSLIEWQRTLKALKKTHVVAYDDVFEDFGKVWCVKGLIATRSNLVMSWKIRLRMGTNYHMMLCGSLAGFPPWWFVYGYLFAVDSFQFVPKNTKKQSLQYQVIWHDVFSHERCASICPIQVWVTIWCYALQ